MWADIDEMILLKVSIYNKYYDYDYIDTELEDLFLKEQFLLKVRNSINLIKIKFVYLKRRLLIRIRNITRNNWTSVQCKLMSK